MTHKALMTQPHVELLFCSSIPYPPGPTASCQCLNISIRLQSQGLWTCYFFFLGWSSPDNLMALFHFFKFTNHPLSQRPFLTTIFTQTTIIILSNSYLKGLYWRLCIKYQLPMPHFFPIILFLSLIQISHLTECKNESPKYTSFYKCLFSL